MGKKIKIIFAKFLLRILGWRIQNNLTCIPSKCVVIGAPHSSWIDVVIGLSGSIVLDLELHYLAKKELFKFPWSLIFKKSGGIPVDRYNPEASEEREKVIENVVDLFKKRDSMILVISPEGTRKKVDRWKSGFYRIAKKAAVPVVLCYIDHERKVGCIDQIYNLTGNQDNDLSVIMKYYSQIPIKYQDRFSLDTRYI